MNVKTFHLAVWLACLACTAQAAPTVSARLQAACQSADFDHDGHVSLDEFHHDVRNSWHALPSDTAGYVLLADLAAIPGMARGMVARLQKADTSGDGKLAFKEVVAARMAYFDAADANGDDRLSMQECTDYQRKQAAAPGKAKR